MVYLSGVRYTKENNKFNLVPCSVSVKAQNYNLKVTKFPVIADVQFVKGTGAIVSEYVKKV